MLRSCHIRVQVFAILIALCGCSDNRRFEYYETGQVKRILPAGNQLLNGVVEEYASNGRIFSETIYENNVLVSSKACPQGEHLQMIYNNLDNWGWIEVPCGPNSPIGKELCNSQMPFACRYLVSPFNAIQEKLGWLLVYVILPLVALNYLVVGYSRLRDWWRK